MPVATPPPSSERFRDPVRIGAGGFSSVYRAFDTELQRPVALKVLHEQDAASQAQLKREFRVLRRVPHPNVVRFHELFTQGDTCFYTMDLVEGRPIDAWLAPAGRPGDLEREARDLVAAVRAIHAAGAIHRDIKPANLLVDDEGRLTVVDFGFATLRSASRRGREGSSGTLAYMAPEAMLGRVVAASDWYSVGVVLHELVVGDLPPPLATDDDLARILAKGAARRGGVSSALLALVRGLLCPQPDAREAAALGFLGDAASPAARTGVTSGPRLFGRDAELAVLHDALERSRSACVVCDVRGPSGIGKSEILRAFIEEVSGRAAMVLEGQCHTTERVPYNALDGIVDDLAQLLATQPAAAAPATREARIAAATLFPVLHQVPGFEADARPVLPVHATRVAALAALEAALARAAAKAPVVLVLEDVQWGDAESAALLNDLLRSTTVPMLVVLSYQWPDAAPGPFLAALQTRDLLRLTVTLEPFDDDTARRWLHAQAGVRLAPESVEYVLSRGEGLPYLLHELVRACSDRPGPVPAQFEDLLASRVGGLEADERAFLDAAALAGLPTHCDVLADAARLHGTGKVRAEYLSAQCLLKMRHGADGLAAATYHENIRRALVSRMPEARRRDLHLRLAQSLERRTAEGTDPEPIFVHYLAAGDEERAGHHAELAGRRAAAALAFDRAARLLREAADLAAGDADRIRRLQALAGALAADGRSLEAARVFERAGRLAGNAGNARESRRLLLEAASHLARGGRRTECLALLRESFAAAGVPEVLDGSARLGEPRPASRLFRLRRRAAGGRGAAVAPEARELLRDASALLMLVDAPAARLALARLPVDDPAAARSHGATALREGLRSFGRAQWAACVRQLDEAIESFLRDGRELCAEVTIARLVQLDARARSGDFVQLRERWPRIVEEAVASGDENAACLFRVGEPVLAWLAADDPARVRREIDVVRASIVGDASPLLRSRLLVAEVLLLLFAGDGSGARTRLLAEWEGLEAAGGFEPPADPALLHWLRARTALSLVETTASRAERWLDRGRGELLADAARCVGALRGLGQPCAAAFALQMEAAIARARGQESRARTRREQAAAAFDAGGMPLHAAACRLRADGADPRAGRAFAEAGVVEARRFGELLGA